MGLRRDWLDYLPSPPDYWPSRGRRTSDIYSFSTPSRKPDTNFFTINGAKLTVLHHVILILTEELLTATWMVILGTSNPGPLWKLPEDERSGWEESSFERCQKERPGIGAIFQFHRWQDFHFKLAASKSFLVSPIWKEAMNDSFGPGLFFFFFFTPKTSQYLANLVI